MTPITTCRPRATGLRFTRNPRHAQHLPRTAMTLLEVMLALTLTAVVLVAISMAIDIHLRLLDSRRGQVEQMQLARGVLQIIANDLRATVQQYSTDFSGVAGMVSNALPGGGESTGDTGGATGENTGTRPDTGSSGSGGATTPSTSTGSGRTSSAPTSGGSGSSLAGAEDLAAGLSGASQNIATSTYVPPVPGLYGNQYELQIDVSRLPRVDEYQRMIDGGQVNVLQDIPSDVKTVAYYCINSGMQPTVGYQRGSIATASSGLVRRVLDRAVTLYAADSGNVMALQQLGDVIAPEVLGIEFEYFDGTAWLIEWDSEQMGGLPVAIRITLMVATPERPDTAFSATSFRATATSSLPYQVYSLVVRIPTAKPIPLDAADASGGLEAVGL